MKPREQYAENEWQTLLFAIFWVFEAVAGADDKIDKRETEALLDGISRFHPTPLVDALHSEVHANFDRLKATYEQDKRDINSGLAEVDTLLARYPNVEHAAETRRSLVQLASLIAEASGGFLGFGSKVSKEEAEAILRIRALLKLPA